jgi:hypothetical protein
MEIAIKSVFSCFDTAAAYETTSNVDFLNLPPAFSTYTKTDIFISLALLKGVKIDDLFIK